MEEESGGSLRWLMQAIARLPPREANEALGAGTMVGRYRLVERIGRGGFGVVYRAVDTELGRDVALKLLHADAATDKVAQDLLHEAQAMARLKQVNIVTVYDVGRLDDGQLFVAMELIDGRSLRHWLDACERSPREILRVFFDAAAGLAAAHAVGLVHRDFKPDNVLVGRDDVARVADFGLATTSGSDGKISSGGTPRYMPLEQAAGAPPDPRMDQFSFAVALWEALAGSHPFGDGELPELRANMTADALAAPKRALPAFLRVPLTKALAADPARRFSSLPELIAALRRDPARRRRRMIVAGGALFAVAALTFGAIRYERARSLVCKGAERKLAGVWDAARRATIRAAFVATGKSFAPASFDATARVLDDYAGKWTRAHEEACEATQIRREQSAAVEDLRMSCLDQRRRQLDAMIGLFGQADGELVGNAARLAARLPDLRGCADVAALSSPIPLPSDPEKRRQIDDARAELARTTVLTDANRVKEALPRSAALVERAKAIGWAPLIADAQLMLGRGQDLAADYKAASATLEEALWTGEAARHDVVVGRAANWLAGIVGTDLRHFSDGERWARFAQAVAKREGNESLERDAEIYFGRIEKQQAHYPEAYAHLGRALAMTERISPDNDTTRLPMILGDLGNLAEQQGRFDEAVAFHRRNLELLSKVDPGHPDVATCLEGIARVEFQRANFAEARKGLERALEMRRARFGFDTASAAEALSALAVVAYQERRFEDAIRIQTEAKTIFLRTTGRGPDVAFSESAIGGALMELKRMDEARPHYLEAIAIFDEKERDHPDELAALVGMAWLNVRTGHWPEAERFIRRAVAIGEKVNAKNQFLAAVLVDVARMKVLAHQSPLSALTDAKRALAIQEEISGRDSQALIAPLAAMGEVLISARRRKEALEVLTRAQKIAVPGSPYRKDIDALIKEAVELRDR
jgi:tetratricopeptide (TPR) repeat protein/predicted Ser/Thr protein kinase